MIFIRCQPRLSVLTQASPGERQSLPMKGMLDKVDTILSSDFQLSCAVVLVRLCFFFFFFVFLLVVN